MTISIIGSVFIITGCATIGFLFAKEYQQTVNYLHQLLGNLEQMERELNYSCCSLPELFRNLKTENRGILAKLWEDVAAEMESQVVPDAETCMRITLKAHRSLPGPVLEILDKLAECLGKYDLQGQLRGITYIRGLCVTKLNALEENMEQRLKNYKIFGICGGIALVIILI